MKKPRHPRLTRAKATPILLICALVAALAFAATAAAETRTGESTSALPEGNPTPEATLIKGAASYETTGGSVVFNVTTAAPPQAGTEAEPSKVQLGAALYTNAGECGSGIVALEGLLHASSPVLMITDKYAEPSAQALLGTLAGEGGLESSTPLGAATKTVAGTTTTLSISSASLTEKSFNCAVVLSTDGEGGSFMGFPIKTPPPPPPPPPPAPAPTPQPAPAALSLAKPKPLKVQVGKSRTVKVKVTNTGATATGLGSLRVKAPKGVIVKPEKQQVPVLLPGRSWTVSVRMELTAKAKKKSTISLIASAPGLSARNSFLVELVNQITHRGPRGHHPTP